ncbi:4a-hydroxytetrahydrobiopterin dehydratase [Nocardia amikacinitolerans]|uniref:Putative pterin-4-alpha-carbinolamine dehydratase n=1 Tax=Nocardia amikacinitolerans TaxID=756689 RepID=A0A285LB00_9NOCA|nr:4a-hydroxytetrahydrobiopterin dehydratase [Nocardia amikacinitolerans]MCP2274979.1 4a-hydroxytetrahydrobiopterin dehydratase [Nocardia amikacinitolerans]MCP2290222.1 4a-hydroxytetrahydrobiopterin dehydratase [Nocardia amikacinitolerans]MCP2296278.1 4a-hydroxytetrahydrobiopterin dehydratase [Nocardia amikacinitolerans]MCP2316285.1 4a-hydroxytetrahydrobiopterin dehydratase [Nocardia amikacinitolerans]SNY80766.1 4a-hydroxytetrahydrobiopterin dehydratase [Nocardia amikacinitolerans]
MSTPLLSEAEIADALAGLPNWSRSDKSITRTIKAASFPAGIDLVRRVADAAEAANHHPDIDIRWRNVTFTLSTHSAGGLTALDLGLAREIDLLASQSE